MPYALADVLLIVTHALTIEGGFRLEIADTEFHATIAKTVAQDGNQAIFLDGSIKALVEFL